eukprot:TRINITY_DN6369_c0_g2_i1.p2 TRINITY_DN6369_c0_g2~~TRINITY_DN6369_c0_g2_i1.p2  ORF type:complete len:123 (+),score=47.42 TRINITY_DN6369_c0_g2_i1:1078-1446(+)
MCQNPKAGLLFASHLCLIWSNDGISLPIFSNLNQFSRKLSLSGTLNSLLLQLKQRRVETWNNVCEKVAHRFGFLHSNPIGSVVAKELVPSILGLQYCTPSNLLSSNDILGAYNLLNSGDKKF